MLFNLYLVIESISITKQLLWPSNNAIGINISIGYKRRMKTEAGLFNHSPSHIWIQTVVAIQRRLQNISINSNVLHAEKLSVLEK